MRRSKLLLAAALTLAVAPAGAQMVAPLPQGPVTPPPATGPLTLDTVLATSRQYQPQILEQLARVRVAEGRRLSVEGAFDTLFAADADLLATGFYNGRAIDTKVIQPLQGNGGNVYAGYRASGGRFPIYDDKLYTNQLGEIRAGAVISLLRDRIIDERRFNRTQAEGEIELADAERLLISIGVQTRALEAYNAWVLAGQRLRIFRGLLELAEDRQRGIQRAVDAGLRPRILLVENEQNILRRRSFVTQSEQALAIAANNLSLFWRDADGRPMLADASRLPDALPRPLPLPVDPRSGLLARPDLRTIEVRMNLARQRLALDRNQLLPRVDLAVEVSRDVGDIGFGGRSREGTESRVGLTVRFPFQNRAARGRLMQTEAEIEAFRRRGQALSEQIVAQIDGIGINIEAATRLARLAEEEAERARQMAAAERRRFELGATDFFVVNLREEAAADAEVRRVDAAYRVIVAHAELAAATADTSLLQL